MLNATFPSRQYVDSTPMLHDPAVRAALLGVVERHGWRRSGQDRLDGTIDLDAINRVPDDRMRTDIGVSIEAYQDAQRLECVHRLPHHPALLALYRTLFDRDVLVHARHIVRMVTGHRTMHPTPPHQDFPLIQGTHNTWTCWFPVGDCPRTLGGLTVLKGSHRLGPLPVVHAKGAGGIATQLCPSETSWREADFSAGDVLTFPSYTIHKALRCEHKDQIRLSFDVRYQPIDEVVEGRSLLPHVDLPWDDIYAGWTRDDLKYYWRRLPLRISEFDDSLTQPGQRRIC